jgi:hypothetical protein
MQVTNESFIAYALHNIHTMPAVRLSWQNQKMNPKRKDNIYVEIDLAEKLAINT